MKYPDDFINKIICGDCLNVMKHIPDESIDLVVTDPAYRTISGGKTSKLALRHVGGMLEKNDGKIFEHNNIEFSEWLPEVFRCLKNKTHCYVMVNTINLESLLQISRQIGFQLHNLLVWKKQNCTPNRWYMKNGEYIAFLRKGPAVPIKDMGSKTVHEFNNPFGNKLHPTEKPVELMEFYISNSSSPRGIILDPFVGSGTAAIAAKNLNRNFIGIDISEEYCEMARKRLAE